MSNLLKDPKGRTFMSALMSKIHPNAQEESNNLNHMGEGSDKAAQKMMMEMPLSSLVNTTLFFREEVVVCGKFVRCKVKGLMALVPSILPPRQQAHQIILVFLRKEGIDFEIFSQ